MNRQIIQGDALEKLKEIDDNSIDLIATDPPYGYSFMNLAFDKAIISVEIWKECLRVLKPGSWAYIMCAPRQDVLSRMIVNLSDAGFKTDFTSIYWAYSTGFPKAANISKLVDKRNGRTTTNTLNLKNKLNRLKNKKGLTNSKLNQLCGFEASNYFRTDNHLIDIFPQGDKWNKIKSILGNSQEIDNELEQLFTEAQREVISQKEKLNAYSEIGYSSGIGKFEKITVNETNPKTNLAKKLDGSYAGFQPKPALEVILVCMKPLSEKSYVEQVMSNGKGITWLDDVRIPFVDESDEKSATYGGYEGDHIDHTDGKFGMKGSKNIQVNQKGRFPANIICSDDALNNGKIVKSKSRKADNNWNESNQDNPTHFTRNIKSSIHYDDSGSFSKYFDLDAWEAQFIITPKPAKSEKNDGLDKFMENTDQYGGKFLRTRKLSTVDDGRKTSIDNPFQRGKTLRQNTHPTVKPITLFKYLITMGSREGDLILDPFMGSGTTAIACEQIARDWIGIEKVSEYVEISKARLEYYRNQNKMEEFL